jgi:DNA mismatch endonuclease, patch repair protein
VALPGSGLGVSVTSKGNPRARLLLAPAPLQAAASNTTTRRAFWEQKLLNNKRRDALNRRRLRRMGWRVLIIWECQLGNRSKLEHSMTRFLTD